MQNQFQPSLAGATRTNTYAERDDRGQQISWVVIGVLGLLLLYAYWNMLTKTYGYWDEPQYSHGGLVPVFAVILLWLRRRPFLDVPAWHNWVGVALVVFGICFRIYGSFLNVYFFDRLSFIPSLLGIFVMVGGLPTLRWAGPPIAFLFFMYPLPRLLENGLMKPMQQLATICSLFALQTFGVDVYREGNTIHLDQMKMGVVDQCSGLRMLTIFAALAVGLALVYRNRPYWERGIIVLSAIPIALAVNVIRITVTGLLYSLNVGHEYANVVFHDAAGLIMMPMALGLLFIEVQILQRLVLDESSDVSALAFDTPTASGVVATPKFVPPVATTDEGAAAAGKTGG